MKKIIFLFLALSTQFSLSSQNDTYTKVKQLIKEKRPELNLSDKLVGFVAWSLKDEQSRDLNKSFENAVHVYEHAKLKGGAKGIVILSVSLDELSSEATIIFQKDGIQTLIPIKQVEFAGLDLNTVQSCVFDSMGTEVYRNLSSSNVFSSINKLITR